MSASVNIPSNTAAGAYYLFFWADGGNCGSTSNCSTCSGAVNESDECNNFATVQITVTSSIQTFAISTSSNPLAGGTTSGAGNYTINQQATVIASSNPGYSFVNWTEGGSAITTNASYVFNVTGNKSLVANFTNCTYTLNSNSVNVYSPVANLSFWVYTTQNCNWTASANGCSWLTFTNSSGTGNGLVTFNLTANESTSLRTCIISVADQTFTVTQNGYVAPCSTTPSAPNSLSASNSGSNTNGLSWAGSIVNFTNFEIERAISAVGPFVHIGDVIPPTTNYFDNTGVPGTTYYYRVRACCNSNCSTYTNTASATSCVWHTEPLGILASTNIICKGGSVGLSPQGGSLGTGDSWTWYNSGNIIGLTQSITVTPTVNSTYCVKPAGSTCPQNVISPKCIDITVNQLPVVNAGNDITISEGMSTTIGGNPTAVGNGQLTYSWTPTTNLNSAFIANPIATPSVSTTYSVSVKDGNLCVAIDDIKVTLTPVTGLEELENDFGLKIYPNPTSGMINIVGTGIKNGNYQFNLTNAIGQQIFTDKVTVTNNEIQQQHSVKEFRTGIYFLFIRLDKEVRIVRLQLTQ